MKWELKYDSSYSNEWMQKFIAKYRAEYYNRLEREILIYLQLGYALEDLVIISNIIDQDHIGLSNEPILPEMRKTIG